jgi:hypothetical protein
VVQVCSSPPDNKLRKSTTLGLPVSLVYCLPLWLNETDARQFHGMIALQVEMRGLQPRNQPAVFDWTVVAKEEARTLVSVGILPAHLPPELGAEAYQSFDLSARYYRFPDNSLTLWREQDRLVAGITRGALLVYCQVLTEGEITTRVVQDLNCVRASLEMQDILPPLQKIVLWTEIRPEERAALNEALPLPIEQSETPPPALPGKPWNLVPASVDEAQRARESQRWIRRGIGIFLVLYLLAVAWFITHFVMTTMQTAKLHKWQSDNAAGLQAVQDGQATWKELGPVVDTSRYPLELLFHVSQSIPGDLHLTLFESSYDHLLIKGEAKNVAGAFQLLTKLKADPYFTGYNLDMGNPRPLPNDLAQFQIEGNRAN